MRAHILAGITLAVLLSARAAYPQAAAESVLLHGNSAAAGAKTGSVLGNALNKAAGKISGQIQNVPQTKQTAPTASSAPRTAIPASSSTTNAPAPQSPSTSGSMIASIQGGHVTRATVPSPKLPVK